MLSDILQFTACIFREFVATKSPSRDFQQGVGLGVVWKPMEFFKNFLWIFNGCSNVLSKQ